MECIPSKKHVCNICNKDYSSRQNLWKHMRKFHIISETKIAHNDTKTAQNLDYIAPKSTEIAPEIKNNCKYCKKVFTRLSSLKRHYKNCKEMNDNTLKVENEKLKEKVEIFEKEIDTMKGQMLELMNKICKIHPKTLTKINKQLNNTMINNTINNTYNIVQLGRENLSEIFSKKEKLDVLRKGYTCLPYLVEYTHFNNKFPQFKNILITNTQNSIAYKYNSEHKRFDAITKDELLEDIVSERIDDINNFNEEYKQYLSDKEKQIIDNVIEKILSEGEFEEEQKNKIKFIIYNNRDKVSKEIIHNLEIII
jgi:hypothetical protein